MIPKIFPPGGFDFGGVGYSQEKVEIGEASLIDTKNFIGLDNESSKEDYLMYLQKFSSKNKRIKLPQFHATISAKGKEESYDNILKFAHHWMKEMGYADNPYLIYKHDDTKNNHIHIVSTRINPNGKKIDDSFEKVKSLSIRNKYFGIDNKQSNEKLLSGLLSYNFQNHSQFKLLLEKHFSNVSEDTESFKFYKEDIKFSVKVVDIKKQIESNRGKNISKDRKNQIKNILLRLSKEHALEDLAHLTFKYGFDIVLFRRKDNAQFFGYSIIDHKEKIVVKGSDVTSLESINYKNLINEKNSINNKIKIISSKKDRIEDLNQKLSVFGYGINKHLQVFSLINKEKFLFEVDPSLVSHIYYNQRLDKVNFNYRPKTKNERILLAYVFGLKVKDIKMSDDLLDSELKVKKATNYYNDVLNFIRSSKNESKKVMNDLSLTLLKRGDHYYILDKNREEISEFTISKDNLIFTQEQKLITELEDQIHVEKSSTIDDVISFMDSLKYHLDYYDEGTKRDRKKSNKKGKKY